MKKALALLTVVSFLFSCNSDPEGYARSKSGLLYRYTYLGDGAKPLIEDYVKFKYTLKTMDDSLLSRSRMIVQLLVLKNDTSLLEALTMLKKDDKANFIIPANDFYKTYLLTKVPEELKDQKLNIAVEIVDVLSDLQYEKSRLQFKMRLESVIMDTSASTENARIAQYIMREHKTMETLPSGLRFHLLRKSASLKKPAFGKTVYIQYRGRFFDGTEFNSTYVNGQPQDFIVGQEMQVIQGIEQMLLQMNEGDVVEMIIPAKLAFGSNGSSSGIVPPNTPVTYELELLSVN